MRYFISLLFLFMSYVYSQNFAGIFIDRLADAKVESMGKILSVSNSPVFIPQSNPALLSNFWGSSVHYSRSGPYLYSDDWLSENVGFTYSGGKYGVVSVNYMVAGLRDDWQSIDEFGEVMIKLDPPKMVSVTYSTNSSKPFILGVRLNKLEWSIRLPDGSSPEFYPVDLGFLTNLGGSDKHNSKIQIGLSASNVFNSEWKYDSDKLDLPSIGRIGIMYLADYFPSNKDDYKSLINLQLSVEYQYLFNYDYRSCYKMGGEIGLMDMFYFRAGYFKDDLNENFGLNSLDYIEDFTFGMGLKLSLQQFTELNDIPITILVDYFDQQQPSYTSDMTFGNFSGINITLLYN